MFAQLDDAQAAEAMAELDDDEMAAKIMGDMADADASRMLSEMDPDDAAELVGELDYERAEKLLRLMGINEQRAIRQLLGYKDDTAGRIMTSEFVSVPRETTVAEVADRMRGLPDDFEPVNYIYLTDADERLCGVVPVRRLFISDADEPLSKLANEDDILTAKPDDDQEDVAQDIAKYNLLAMPVVDEKNGKVLGIVTVDDALDVMEEEHEEDLRIAGGTANSSDSETNSGDLMRFLRNEMWFFFWMVAAVVLAVALGPDTGVAVAFAAPVALVAAVEMVRFVTNFFLEYDEDDEDAPSVAGFAVKSVGMGVLWAAIVMLVCAAANGVVNGATEGLGAVVFQLLRGFEASALAVVVTFVLAPVYLVLLRRRDEQGNDTSGLALQTVALVLAAVVFVGVALALATPVLG